MSNVVQLQEAYATGLQPSMSRSDILIECSYPFGKDDCDFEVGEAGWYGSGFHEVQADLIVPKKRSPTAHAAWLKQVFKRWNVERYADEIVTHAKEANGVLMSWLGKNEFRIDFSKGSRAVEEAVALRPLISGRPILSHDEDHRYHGLTEGELPGTSDLRIECDPTPPGAKRRAPDGKRHLVVLDHKTGEEDFSRPLDKPQLLSLAAANMRWRGFSEAYIGVLHARRRGMPKVYAEKVKLKELLDYERRLAAGLARIGDGSMKPGKHCRWCPARSICPAQDAELLSKAGDVLTGLTAAGGALSAKGVSANDVAIVKVAPGTLSRAKQLGHLYDVMRLGRKMIERASAEIKQAILDDPGLLPETSAGEYLIVREYEKESLSKSSIIAAYGATKGERMLAKLREDGAIKKSKVQQLWPEKERGR